MSGGVGQSCNDVGLQKGEEQEQKVREDLTSLKNPDGTTSSNSDKASYLSFYQLNVLAVIVVLAASGRVSPEDFIFVVFSVIYMYFMAIVAFPSLNPTKDSFIFARKDSVLWDLYLCTGGIIGLFLPIVYIFGGVVEGDKEGIKAAAPHVFLLASQIFMEGVAYSGRFSIPIRAFVPVFYNSRRIFTILEWLKNEVSKKEPRYAGPGRGFELGRALAAANLVFWCFNLFGFLLPIYLPKAFRKYYSTQIFKD